MSVNSFGYEVMTLDEIIDKLQRLREAFPLQGGEPVWIDNCPPLKWPILNIGVEDDTGILKRTPHRVKVFVERGGN